MKLRLTKMPISAEFFLKKISNNTTRKATKMAKTQKSTETKGNSFKVTKTTKNTLNT